MIPLTLVDDGRTVYINPRLVESVANWQGTTHIQFAGDSQSIRVMEPAAEVAKRLSI
jgi:hypothetical protein